VISWNPPWIYQGHWPWPDRETHVGMKEAARRVSQVYLKCFRSRQCSTCPKSQDPKRNQSRRAHKASKEWRQPNDRPMTGRWGESFWACRGCIFCNARGEKPVSSRLRGGSGPRIPPQRLSCRGAPPPLAAKSKQ
jgi:hypothetical protein